MSEPTWELLGGGGVLGPAGIDYVGPWAAGTQYQPGAVVRYQGVDYLAVNPSIGQTPPAARSSLLASYGTTLPASPFDGQEAVLVDSLTAPTYSWRFRYNAGSTSPYKWEFVGGADYYSTAQIGAYGAISSGWGAMTPVFYPPRSGEWDAVGEAQFTGGTTASFAQLSIGTTAQGSIAQAMQLPGVNYHISLCCSNRIVVAAGVQLSLWTYASHADMSSVNRWLRVRPVKVA